MKGFNSKMNDREGIKNNLGEVLEKKFFGQIVCVKNYETIKICEYFND